MTPCKLVCQNTNARQLVQHGSPMALDLIWYSVVVPEPSIFELGCGYAKLLHVNKRHVREHLPLGNAFWWSNQTICLE